MTDRYDEQTILDYVEGDLPEAEAHAFKLKMLTDAELRSLVEQLEADRAALRAMPLEQPPDGLMDLVNDQLERRVLLGGGVDELEHATAHRRLRFTRAASYLALAAMFILGVGLLYQAMMDMTGRPAMDDRGLVALRDAQRQTARTEEPVVAGKEEDDALGRADALKEADPPRLALGPEATAANERMNLLMDAPEARDSADETRALRTTAEASMSDDSPQAPQPPVAAMAKSETSPKAMAASTSMTEPGAAPTESEAMTARRLTDAADARFREAASEAMTKRTEEVLKAADALQAPNDAAVAMGDADASDKHDPLAVGGAVMTDAGAATTAPGVDGIAQAAPTEDEPRPMGEVSMSTVAGVTVADEGMMAKKDEAAAPDASPAPTAARGHEPAVADMRAETAPPPSPAPPVATAAASRMMPAPEAQAAAASTAPPAKPAPVNVAILIHTDDIERSLGQLMLWATRRKLSLMPGEAVPTDERSDFAITVTPGELPELLKALARDRRQTARIAAYQTDAETHELVRRIDDADKSAAKDTADVWRDARAYLRENDAEPQYHLDDEGRMTVPILIRKR